MIPQTISRRSLLLALPVAAYLVLYTYGWGGWGKGGIARYLADLAALISVLALPKLFDRKSLDLCAILLLANVVTFFLVCVLLFWLNSDGPITATAFEIQTRYLLLLPFFFLFHFLLQEKIDSSFVLCIFLITASAFSLLAATEYFYKQWVIEEASFRLKGYTNSQHYGNFAMLIFGATAALHAVTHIVGSSRRIKFFLALLATTTLACGIASQSRTALLSIPITFAFVLYYVWATRGLQFTISYIPKAISIVIISLIINAHAVINMFEKSMGQAALVEGSTSLESSGFHRAEMWVAAIKVWQQSPLTGVGFGRYPEEAKKYLTETKSTYIIENEGKPHHAHSGYFEYLAGGGIIGLCSLIMLLFLPLFYFLRGLLRNKATDSQRLYCLIGSIITCVFITGNLTENYVFFKGWISLYVILSSLLFAATLTTQTPKTDPATA